jgi:hypothetical protein
MSFPPLTSLDIEADLRRLGLARGAWSPLALACSAQGGSLKPLVDLLDEDERLAEWVVTAASLAKGSPAIDLAEAVLQLGFEEVCRMVLLAHRQRYFADPHTVHGSTARQHLKQAVIAASLHEQIALALGHPARRAFAAGLMHGIGRSFVGWHCGRWGIRLNHTGEWSHRQVREETMRFEMNQCDAASEALGRLGFGEEITLPVRWWGHPQFAGPWSGDAERLQASVELALLQSDAVDRESGAHAENLTEPQRVILERALPRARFLLRIAEAVSRGRVASLGV